MRLLKATFSFYWIIFPASFIITLLCTYLLYLHGIRIFFMVFWFKIIVLSILLLFVKSLKKNEFYYYHNLGLSTTRLYSSAISYDLLLFFLSVILSRQFI